MLQNKHGKCLLNFFPSLQTNEVDHWWNEDAKKEREKEQMPTAPKGWWKWNGIKDQSIAFVN